MRLTTAGLTSRFVFNYIPRILIVCRIPSMTAIIAIAIGVFVTIAMCMAGVRLPYMTLNKPSLTCTLLEPVHCSLSPHTESVIGRRQSR